MAGRMLPSGRRAGDGPVIVLPKSVFDTDEYRALSDRARTLLTFMHLTYTKFNNGSLCLIFSTPKAYGFGGRSLMAKARDELLNAGWISITHEPTAKRDPILYALTWLPINEDSAKGVKGNPVPSGLWQSARASERDAFGRPNVVPSARRVRKSRPSRVDGQATSTDSNPCPGSRDNTVPITGIRVEPIVPAIGTEPPISRGCAVPAAGNSLPLTIPSARSGSVGTSDTPSVRGTWKLIRERPGGAMSARLRARVRT